VNPKAKKPLPTWLPLVIGTLLVAQFAGLGAWQVSRGLEKRAEQQLFRDETGFAAWQDGMEIRPYQRLKASGVYDGDHQFLLENIIVNSHYGYYVLTPLVANDGEPVLLVNRGWIEKTAEPQTFTFEQRTALWLRFTDLVQEEPLGWCAFTEVEVWGRDAKVTQAAKTAP